MGGGMWGSLFVAKLDVDGHLLWSRSFDNADVGVGVGFAVDGSGDVLLTGTFRDTTDFGGGTLVSAGHGDIYVARLDPDGNHLASKAFGDDAPQLGGAIAVDAAGDVFLTGAFSGSTDFGGGPLPLTDALQAIYELDPALHHVWSRSFDGDDNDAGQRIAVSPDGSVAVTGSYLGALDLGGGVLPTSNFSSTFLLRLDAAGQHVFSAGYSLMAAAPVFDGAGNLYVSGPFAGDADFGGGPMNSGYFIHLAVAKLDAGNQLLWSEQYGEIATTVYGASAFPGGGDALLIAGYASGKLDFGGGELLGGSHLGGFLARLDGAGHHLWSRGFGGDGDLHGE